MSRSRYKIGDKLYQVTATPEEEYDEGVVEKASVTLHTYIIRSIRRSNTKALVYNFETKPKMVTAYPSTWVKETKKGLVFDKHCPRWAIECWRIDADKPNHLHRTKSAAYRAELADLRDNQRGAHMFDEPLTDVEFRYLEGRLKSGITRNTVRKVAT